MKKRYKTILSILISVLFLVIIFYKIDFSQMKSTFLCFNFSNIYIIISIYLGALVLRVIRWHYLLLADKKNDFYNLGRLWVLGNFLNVFLPARAGDVWRAYSLGCTNKDSKMKMFGSIMLERILDGISVCAILYLAVITFYNTPLVKHLANLSMLVFGGALLFCYLIVKFEKIDLISNLLIKFIKKFPAFISEKLITLTEKILMHLKSFIEGFLVLKNLKYTLWVIFYSIIIWGLECIMTYFIIISFSLNVPMSSAFFILSFIALSSMIPSSSVYIGPYQYAYILALSLYHIPKSEALAVAFGHQCILISILIIFSGLVLLIDFIKKYLHHKNI